MSALTADQLLAIEAVAAQLHDRDEKSVKAQLFWPMVDEQVRQRYRLMARRKLRTGEIDGWWKLQPNRPGECSKPDRNAYHRHQAQAAE